VSVLRIKMDKSLIKVSKFFSFVLRHKPKKIGLSLEQGGWAQVNELLAKANLSGVILTKDLLHKVVEQNDKQRFVLSEDGLMIRANYGHSIPVDLGFEPIIPPELLFHGTATKYLYSIMRQGIVPRKRNFVHLSADEPTAISVGRRHGKPVVLTIKAERMHADGFKFYCMANSIWLTGEVPVEYLIVKEDSKN